MIRHPFDLIAPEEKARRRKVVRGWTFKIENGNDIPFINHCTAYITGHRNDPPAEYQHHTHQAANRAAYDFKGTS